MRYTFLFRSVILLISTMCISVWAGGIPFGFFPFNNLGQTSKNVALASNGGTASTSSIHDSNFPASAINNGDRSGLNWGSGGGWNDGTASTYPDWAQVTFNDTYIINEIDVFTLQDSFGSPSTPTLAMTFLTYGIVAFQVQYWNGSSWVTVPGGNVTGNNKVWTQFTFSPVWTNAIRVTITASAGANNYSRVTELEGWTSP